MLVRDFPPAQERLTCQSVRLDLVLFLRQSWQAFVEVRSRAPGSGVNARLGGHIRRRTRGLQLAARHGQPVWRCTVVRRQCTVRRPLTLPRDWNPLLNSRWRMDSG
jgi:hypothetical protein